MIIWESHIEKFGVINFVHSTIMDSEPCRSYDMGGEFGKALKLLGMLELHKTVLGYVSNSNESNYHPLTGAFS